MALQTNTIQFTQPTSTNASFAVTGVGFKPKAAIFFCNDETANNVTDGIQQVLGFATSSTKRSSMTNVLTDNAASGAVTRGISDIFCIYIGAAGAAIVKADFVSFDADGCTLNFSTVDSNARLINVLFLGGSDLTNATVITVTPPTSTGSSAVTGVGFKPDAVFYLQDSSGTITIGASGPNPGFGWCDSALNQSASGFTLTTNTSQASYQRTTKIVATSSVTLPFYEGNLTSMDSDGFTINWTTVNASARLGFALCLKGGKYFAGSFNQPTGTGNSAVTGTAFKPTGVMFGGVCQTTNASVDQTAHRQFVGAMSGASNRASSWFGGTYSSVTITAQDCSNTKAIRMLTEAATGSSSTVNADADFSSFDANGFTLNWSTADATAREVRFMAFGYNAYNFFPFF